MRLFDQLDDKTGRHFFVEQLADRQREMNERIVLYKRKRVMFDPSNLVITQIPAPNYNNQPNKMHYYGVYKYVTLADQKA